MTEAIGKDALSALQHDQITSRRVALTARAHEIENEE